MKNMSTDEKAVIKGFHLLTTKPVMYIANVAEDGFENNPHLDVVKAIAEEEGAMRGAGLQQDRSGNRRTR